jgi:acetyltransferase-like isoleucine patch superfamily enzyme
MGINYPIAFLGKGKISIQIQNFINSPIISFDEKGDLPFHSYSDHYVNYEWILGFGYYHMEKRVSLTKKIIQNDGKFHTYKHPTSYSHSSSQILDGVIIYPMCNIDQNTIINQNVLLNNSVTICHDSNIGIGSYISPGVVICGEVNIGKGCFIGAGSIISNGVTIGDFSTIGAGTVVSDNLPPYSNAIGNPMKILNKKLKLL